MSRSLIAGLLPVAGVVQRRTYTFPPSTLAVWSPAALSFAGRMLAGSDAMVSSAARS
jgi:hypothetical protein